MIINLMFHCVISENFPFSGFQNKTAQEYKIEVDVFKTYVQCCKNLDLSVTFTFDDGGSSFYFVIADILEEYGFKGIFFIATSYVGTPGFLTNFQILDLHRRGHYIGSHSHSHFRDMTVLNRGVLEKEWKISIDLLEKWIGDKVINASVPNGHVSRRVLLAAREVGICNIYTSKPTMSSWLLDGMVVHGRFSLRKNDNLDILNLIVNSSLFRRKLLLRYFILDILRRVFGNAYFTIVNIYRYGKIN